MFVVWYILFIKHSEGWLKLLKLSCCDPRWHTSFHGLAGLRRWTCFRLHPEVCVKGRSMPQHQLKLRALERSQRWTEPCFKRSLPGILSQWCTQCWKCAKGSSAETHETTGHTFRECQVFQSHYGDVTPGTWGGLCSWAACWSFQAGFFSGPHGWKMSCGRMFSALCRTSTNLVLWPLLSAT